MKLSDIGLKVKITGWRTHSCHPGSNIMHGCAFQSAFAFTER